MVDTRSKYWCFTLNNPLPNYADLKRLIRWSYMCVGKEVGDNGTPHLQGFIAMESRVRFTTMKKLVPKAHIEVMYGTTKQAIEYCKKDGDWEEYGVLPVDTGRTGGTSGGQRKAENFKRMVVLAKEDKMDEVLDIDPVSYVQHYHAFKRIRQDHPKKLCDLDGVCGEWIWGEPGIGKSRAARQENNNIYDKPANKWWDGYQGEEVILIDDFDLNHRVLGHHLKRWADRYSFPAEMKGTTIQIRPKKIVVTSNYSIEDVFAQDGEALVLALKRRFKERKMVSPLAMVEEEDSEDPLALRETNYDSDLENCP